MVRGLRKCGAQFGWLSDPGRETEAPGTEPFAWPEEDIQAIAAPTLLIYGDADVIRRDHIVELLRLFGGGVPGNMTSLPNARLAVLLGTTHVGVMNRIDWLAPMMTEFLDEPMPEAA